MRRHQARRQALAVLYESELTDGDTHRPLGRLAASGGLEAYAAELVEGVSSRKPLLDRILNRYAQGWDSSHMPPVDLTIQRLALYELLFAGVPVAVAIDEAVELAKEFSTEECARFVNGVLAAVARDLPVLLRSEELERDGEPPPIPPEFAIVERLKGYGSEFCPPAYSRRSVVEVGLWILAALGMGSWDEDTFDLPPPPQVRRLVVVVIDGLGAIQLRDRREALPFVWSLPGTFATSTFPSTSATALVSICTGRFPKEHGIAGYRFLERGRRFNVIKYEYDPDAGDRELAVSGVLRAPRNPPLPSPKRLQPQPTVFEVCSRGRLPAFVVTRAEFEGTAFSDLLLRGARWWPYRKSTEVPKRVREVLNEIRRGLVYVYWDGLDRCGHEEGPETGRWLEMAGRADAMCRRIADLLGRDDAMLVVSDHGMVETRATQDSAIPESVLELTAAVGGEPRVRYMYAKPGRAADLKAASEEVFGDRAWVWTRDEAHALGLYGPVDVPGSVDRAGDTVVAMRGSSVLRDPDAKKGPPRGNHGSLTNAEMLVPFRIAYGR